jgi:hypothetical protein
VPIRIEGGGIVPVAISTVGVRVVGILPEFEVLAARLLPNLAFGGPEQGEKIGDVGGGQGKANDAEQHSGMGYGLGISLLAKVKSKLKLNYKGRWGVQRHFIFLISTSFPYALRSSRPLAGRASLCGFVAARLLQQQPRSYYHRKNCRSGAFGGYLGFRQHRCHHGRFYSSSQVGLAISER